MLKEADISSAIISSTVRTPADQARIMYDNIVAHGVDEQKKLYGTAGDKVIDEYSRLKMLGKTEKEIKEGMEAKINDVGSTNVSKHCCNPTALSIFDVAPSSIPESHKKDFVAEIKKAKDR